MGRMLADRNKFIPGGFRFIQPEISPNELGDPSTSFDVLVNRVIELRRANPALAKAHKLSLDYAAVAKEVDDYNSQICVAHGWTGFVAGGSAGPFQQASPSPLKARLESAAGSVKRVAAGVRTLLDWLGSGGKPVEASEAGERAAICVSCPLNKPGDWKSYFTGVVANQIRLQLEMKSAMELKTPMDEALHICAGCDCPLKLKVWAPMEHILENTTEETKQRLDACCWILKA